jgi:hypothetical protein
MQRLDDKSDINSLYPDDDRGLSLVLSSLLVDAFASIDMSTASSSPLLDSIDAVAFEDVDGGSLICGAMVGGVLHSINSRCLAMFCCNALLLDDRSAAAFDTTSVVLAASTTIDDSITNSTVASSMLALNLILSLRYTNE